MDFFSLNSLSAVSRQQALYDLFRDLWIKAENASICKNDGRAKSMVARDARARWIIHLERHAVKIKVRGFRPQCVNIR